MSEIIIKHIGTDLVSDEHTYLEKAFSIDGKEIVGQVDRLSLNPLRFLEYALIKKGLRIKKLINGNDPWNIEELTIECNEYYEIEILRCLHYLLNLSRADCLSSTTLSRFMLLTVSMN